MCHVALADVGQVIQCKNMPHTKIVNNINSLFWSVCSQRLFQTTDL